MADARKKLAKHLPVKDLGIAVKSSGPISDGGLLISFPTKKDMDVAASHLKQNQVKESTGWTHKVPGKLLPKLTIANADKHYGILIRKSADLKDDDVDEFRESIAAQNQWLIPILDDQNNIFEVLFFKQSKSRKDCVNVVVKVSPAIRKLIMLHQSNFAFWIQTMSSV